MATYGISYYGPPTKYGPELTVLNTFSTGPLVVDSVLFNAKGELLIKAQQANQLVVAWVSPTTGTTYRLLRNGFNLPDNENDGTIVATGAVGSAFYAIDTLLTVSTPSKFVYYSIFVQDVGGVWHRGGDGMGLLPIDYGYGDRLYDLLPQYYRGRDLAQLDTRKPGVTDGPLKRFLKGIGDGFNTLRGEYESLRSVNDPHYCSGGLLPLLANQLGFHYESQMGMRRNRKLIANLVHLYKIKGTRVGIESVTSALTGWGATVQTGINFMLDPQTLPFVVTPSSSVATIVRAFPVTGTLGGMPAPTGYPITLDVTSGNYPTPTATYLSANNYPTTAYYPTGSPAVLNWSSLNGLPVQKAGIPVSANQRVSLSVYVWSAELHGLKLWINFYDGFGNFLSAGSVTTNTFSAAAWFRANCLNTLVPPGAVWAELVGSTTEAVSLSKPIYFAMPQIEYGAIASAYQPPRDIRINLLADRVNLMTNPSMESGAATGWFAGSNTNTPTVVSTGVIAAGTYAGRVTSIAAGPMSVYSSLMNVTPGLLYSAQAKVEAEVTAQQATISIIFYDKYGNMVLDVVSNPLTELVGSYTLLSLAMAPLRPAPDIATQAYVVISWANSAPGEAHRFDAIMFEQSISVRPYFDAEPAGSGNNDYAWGGAPHLSQSFYYTQRISRKVRLARALLGMDPLLPSQTAPGFQNGFIPAGMTYTLLDAQPV